MSVDIPFNPRSPVSCAQRKVRGAAIAACALILVMTLWPRLAIGSADSPIDKLAHAASFAAFMVLVAHSRWTQSIPLAAFLVCIFAALDEFAQAIPGLGRSADLLDWCADVVGIVIAAAFILAFAPVGVGAARLLSQRRRIAADLLLARILNWMHLATAAVLGFAAGAPLGVLLDSWFVRKGPQPWQYGFIGGILGAGVALHALWEAGVRSRLRRATLEQPCLACGTTLQSAQAVCSNCGRARKKSDWAPIVLLSNHAEFAACLLPILLSLGLIVGFSVVSIVFVTTLRLRSETVMNVDTWYRMMPADARILGDILLVALSGALGIWLSRQRIAKLIDACDSKCLACGFDLRATDVHALSSACSECGGGFVRIKKFEAQSSD